jgi:hypothetical protein
MITVGTIISQMNDGIHFVKDFMIVDDMVHYASPADRNLDTARQLLPVPRAAFIDAIDPVAGNDWDVMESLYGKYNAFAMEPGTNRYYAWYDNCR